MEEGAAKWWWAPLVMGLAWFVIAWLVLRANATSLKTVGVLVGILFLVAAVSEGGLATVVRGGWKVLHIALGVFFVLGALWAFIRPIDTFFALASVLGLLLFLQGFFYLMEGIALREESPYWWLSLTSGILLIALGIWVSTSDREWNLASRAAFILLWVGFLAIFRGIRDIALAFELRRLGSGAPLLEGLSPGADGRIPVQEPRSAQEQMVRPPSGRA
jgi:uncharacterized membrane protein HdeD (DUF308 family)